MSCEKTRSPPLSVDVTFLDHRGDGVANDVEVSYDWGTYVSWDAQKVVDGDVLGTLQVKEKSTDKVVEEVHEVSNVIVCGKAIDNLARRRYRTDETPDACVGVRDDDS